MAFLRPRKSPSGFGKFIALIIMCTFLYIWPYCANLWWREMTALIKKHDLKLSEFFLIWNICQAFCISAIGHTFFGICYYFEFDFIESYAIAEEPWPWKTMEKKEWHRMLLKTIGLYVFNIFIIGPLALGIPVIILNLPLDTGTSPVGIPSRRNFVV